MRLYNMLHKCAVLALLLLLLPPLARAERRTALVIDNAAYETGLLRNPVHDASDISTALRQLGFEAPCCVMRVDAPRYVSYYAAVAYCKEQGAKLPLLNHYRVASGYREGSIEVDYATSYSAPTFHFMQAEWTNTWWDSSGPRDPGKRLSYMYRTTHSGQKGSAYSPEQENRYTGGSLGFRCMQ